MTIAYSEATQPLTLTSNDDTSEFGFTVFCAIATTTSTAFDDDVPPKPGSGSDRKPAASRSTRGTASAKRSESVSGQPSQNRSEPTKKPRLSLGPDAHKQSSVVYSAPGTTRLRESLLLPSESQDESGSQTSQSYEASRGQRGETGSQAGRDRSNSQLERTPGSQTEGAGPSKCSEEADPPLPRTSQRITMTQQEIMALSGMGDMNTEDLFTALDDAEEDDEMQGIKYDSPGRGGDEENIPLQASETVGRVSEPDLSIFDQRKQQSPTSEIRDDTVDEEGEAAQEEVFEPDASEEMPSTQKSGREVCGLTVSFCSGQLLIENSFRASSMTSELRSTPQSGSSSDMTSSPLILCIIYTMQYVHQTRISIC